MSFYAFFLVMPSLPRQEIAELFIVLIMLLLVIKNISMTKKSLLFMIFMSSLIVSHYGTTYIFLFYLILVCIGLMLIKATNTTISPNKILFSCVLVLSWYIYISSSSVFSSLAHIIDNVYSTVFNEMFSSSALDPDIAKGFGVGITELDFLHAMGHFWMIVTEVLIFVGLFYSIIKYKKMKFNIEYFLFSLTNMLFIFMSIILPYFASSLLMYRIYQITLLFLSPFCIIGVEAILKAIFVTLKHHIDFVQFKDVKSMLLIIILIPYFLFNTGFIYEISENPSSYDLNLNPIDKNKNINYYSKWSYFTAVPIPIQDVFACQWITDKIDSNPVYVDELRKSEITGYGMIINTRQLTPNTQNNRVVYLGYHNIMNGVATYLDPQKVHSGIQYNITEMNPPLETRNRIYTNNGSVFYI